VSYKELNFDDPVTLLPVRGGLILKLSQMLVSATGRGLGIWRLLRLLCLVFPEWRELPVVGPDNDLFRIDLKLNPSQLFCSWLTSEIQPCIKHIKAKQPVALDIGANIGVWTRVLSKLYPQAKVFAFEPSPSNFEQLELNCKDRKNVFLQPIALGAETGVVCFSGDSVSPGLRSIQTGKSELPDTIKVPISTLSDWVVSNRLTKIDFIKIDVEGFEKDVLVPARNLLERHHPVICFEYVPELATRSSFEGYQLIQFLQDLSYRVYRIEKNGRLHMDFNENFDWTNNYLAAYPVVAGD